ncbi:hypothetical protein E1B28_006933 [Marasmius oreades]|uniref:Uncharacterized protein n=1 Tax=Marasmius oreades TaxID=181124 RepID=A0A9P7S183_9AGAR|nr:uncharacterized protein E1B28_006933 [Marasmius oreades]KAG7093247.1 hypothetical protein E1B28_006933 [Marasmius oreades]
MPHERMERPRTFLLKRLFFDNIPQMLAGRQSHAGSRRREELGGNKAIRWELAGVRRLQRALVNALASATRDGDVFRMNLIGGALGILAKARAFESLGEGIHLGEEQDVALLLCDAVYIFERSCARESDSQDPLVNIIRNSTRGEDLAKLVIDSGLSYIVNPSPISFGLRHPRQTPYRYFHSQLKEALEKAQIESPEDITVMARELLGGMLFAHVPGEEGAVERGQWPLP